MSFSAETSEMGKPSIGSLVVTAAHRGATVVIEVEDDGPGIPPGDLERVFEPFYRGEPSRNRETGGVGLGLAIVKTCIESCGGTVYCENRAPSGLRVVILLAHDNPT